MGWWNSGNALRSGGRGDEIRRRTGAVEGLQKRDQVVTLGFAEVEGFDLLRAGVSTFVSPSVEEIDGIRERSKLTRMAERGAPAHAAERGSAEGAVRTRRHLGGDAAIVAIAVLSAGVQRIGEQFG